MTRDEVFGFMRRAAFWVEATVHEDGGPQAAVIGVAVTDEGELVFDTLASTRKCKNMRRDGRIALVMWDEASTVQLEGPCDEPRGEDLARVKAAYLARFPDGAERERWPDIAYFRVRPAWVRHTDFGGVGAPRVTLLAGAALTRR